MLPCTTMPVVDRDHGSESFFITLTARALGSLGLGLSVLAIWVRWIIPAPSLNKHHDPPRPRRLNSHRRRSAPAEYNYQDIPTSIPRTKHVYFLDSSIQQHKPRNSIPADDDVNSQESSSTSTADPPSHEKYVVDLSEESVAESESSSRQSSRVSLALASRLPRINISFQNKKRQLKYESAVTSSDGEHSLSPHPARSSSFRRCHTAIGISSSKCSSPSRLCFTRHPPSRSVTDPITLDSSTSRSSFFPKPQRRTSAPVRRTQPYDAPYFASPPVLLDVKERGRAALGISHRPVPKRRSASAGLLESALFSQS